MTFLRYRRVLRHVVGTGAKLLGIATIATFVGIAWFYPGDTASITALAFCGVLVFLLTVLDKAMMDDILESPVGVGIYTAHHKGCSCPSCLFIPCQTCKYCHCVACTAPDTNSA
jgi:hypothetical protein